MLEVLDLSNNDLTTAAIKTMAEMLGANKTLLELYLNSQKSKLGYAAENAMVKAVEGNKTVVKVEMDTSQAPSRTKLKRALESNAQKGVK